jgi:hypothetical protein
MGQHPGGSGGIGVLYGRLKKKGLVGMGISGPSLRHYEALGTTPTIFQAEMNAINVCARCQNLPKSRMYIWQTHLYYVRQSSCAKCTESTHFQLQEDTCRLCMEESETAQHVLCECQATAQIRLKRCVEGLLDPTSVKRLDPKSILGYLKDTYTACNNPRPPKIKNEFL